MITETVSTSHLVDLAKNRSRDPEKVGQMDVRFVKPRAGHEFKLEILNPEGWSSFSVAVGAIPLQIQTCPDPPCHEISVLIPPSAAGQTAEVSLTVPQSTEVMTLALAIGRSDEIERHGLKRWKP